MVLAVKQSITANIFGNKVEIPFKSAGFMGMCPVFDNKVDADEWADDKTAVLTIEAKDLSIQS
jgi:hypothetical protein